MISVSSAHFPLAVPRQPDHEASFSLPAEIATIAAPPSLDAAPALIARRPVDAAEYAPNGFGDDSLGPITFIHELSAQTRRQLDEAFGVNGFRITSGLPDEAFKLADLHTTFPGSTENGASGKHDATGTSYAWISRNQSATAAQMGVPEHIALEVVAAQEAMHSIVRAHPELRGKFTSAESEIMGELASLAVSPNYDIMTLRNALMGHPGPNGNVINPDYALIARKVIDAMDTLFTGFGVEMSGGAFLNDYIMWNAQRSPGGFGAGSVTHDNLRDYVAERLGIDSNAFMELFPQEIFASFESGVHRMLQEKLAMPDL